MGKLPYFRQSTEYTCGPAVLRSVFAYYGKEYSEEEIAKSAGTRESIGTPRKGMIAAAQKVGLQAEAKSGASWEDLQIFIQKGTPVIVRFVEPEDDEHYALVTKVTDMNITLSDPYHGPETAYSRTDFLRMWNAKNANRWILIVSIGENSKKK